MPRVASEPEVIAAMGFWSAYESSLKSRDVEEPIDLWVHRPLGYVVARTLLATPISPNQITMASIGVGWVGASCLLLDFPWHFALGGACLVLSAILDCADGQLARMRRSSSAFGRMLDGVADTLVLLAAVGACTWILWVTHRPVPWQGALALVSAALTVWTSRFHALAHDHYKNVYLRMTVPGSREGDDLESAAARLRAMEHEDSSGLLARVGLGIYVGYLRGQRSFLRGFDPWTPKRLELLPAHDPRRAAIFRAEARGAMRLVASVFGVGTLVFTLAIFVALGRPDLYIAFRVIALNAVFWGVVRPRVRAASRRTLAALPELSPAVDASSEPLPAPRLAA